MSKLTSLRSEKRLLDRQAADSIRAHILDGTLPAGARLLEMQLAEELEVSRGTVRAALALLASEGLVTQVAFTRWQVSETTPRDAWEIYTLRAALEGLAARLAAANAGPADAEALRATIAEMARAVEDAPLRRGGRHRLPPAPRDRGPRPPPAAGRAARARPAAGPLPHGAGGLLPQRLPRAP